MKAIKLFAFIDVSHPMVAWETYIGRIASSDLAEYEGFYPISLRHAAMLQDLLSDPSGERLNAELKIESVRLQSFRHQVSRLRGLYFFESIKDAYNAAAHWSLKHFKTENLVEVGVSANCVTRVDSEWITRNFFSPDDDWIRKYWDSQAYDNNPLWEVLVSGIGAIWGTSLRMKAYHTVKDEFPYSLALVELARVAFDMGFTLGQIIPYVTQNSTFGYKLNYLMDFRDAEKTVFLDALKHYDGQKNLADMSPNFELVVPDLRTRMFEFSLEGAAQYPVITTNVPDHGDVKDLETHYGKN